MNGFLDQEILGNPLKYYFILAGVLLVMLIIKRFLSKGIASICFSIIKRWAPQIAKKEFVDLLLRPLEYFLLLLTFMFTINRFRFPPQLDFVLYKRSARVQFTLQDLTDILLELTFCVCIIWILLRLLDFISLVLKRKADLTDEMTDIQFIVFFSSFFKAIILILGAVVMIRLVFGQGLVEKLIAALGIGAVALALAARESIENLIGSFIIFFDKPFREGDSVKVDIYQGTVEKIGLRSTRLRTLEKTFVTVPNKKMVDSILDNLTLRTQQRVFTKLELPSDTTSESVMKVLKDINTILQQNSNVLPEFTVNLHDFNRDTYLIQVIYNTYIIEGNQYAALREAVNLAIIRSLETHGVKLPSTRIEVVENNGSSYHN